MKITAKIRTAFISLLVLILLLGATPLSAADKPNLLIYCGITMVRPITELARRFEQQHLVSFQISQGGSEDLYQSAKKSQVGDLYLPGSPTYRKSHFDEGLLGDYEVVGYNQLSLFVHKGNPKQVKPNLDELLRDDLVVLIGNPESGSVGRKARNILKKAGIYDEVFSKAAMLLPDSRSLNLILKSGTGDVSLNWRATAFFADNAPHIEVVDLDASVSTPQALQLNLLTFSQYPEIARRFMDYVASEEGQAVFREYGFLDNKTSL